MPPGVTVNRHAQPDDESETIDLESDQSHSHSEEEETEDEEDDDDYSEDEHIHEEDLESSVTSSEFRQYLDVESSLIDPSDSASLRQPTTIPRSASQRRYQAPPRPTGRRVHSSRDYGAVSGLPSAPLPRRSYKRPSRTRSVLESPMGDDDYGQYGGYGRHGALPHHPPPWESYSGSRSTISGYEDPYMAHEPMNPFMMPAEPNYHSGRRGHPNRMSMPSRAPSGHELMTVGPYGAQYNPYGMPHGYPPYGGHPAYPGYYPPHGPSPGPSSKKGSAGDDSKPKSDPQIEEMKQMLLDGQKREQARLEAEAKKIIDAKHAEASAKLRAEEDKLAALQALILKHNAEQLEREKKMEAARQSELAAKAAAEARALEEKRRADDKDKEIKYAKEQAKMEAEKEAQKKADEEKAKHEKEIEEVKKKAAELEAAKKKFEEEAKSLRPKDDMTKPPIKFKDAVGRKFNFPWHICKTWKGTESLILQAFSHIADLGELVQAGKYDLIGPDNEIILPQVWETMVKPDMAISMQMWPVHEKKKAPLPMMPPHMGHPGFHGMDVRELLGGGSLSKKDKEARKKEKEREKKLRAQMGMPPMGMMPPPPPPVGSLLGGGNMPPPPPPPGMHMGMPMGVMEMPKKAKSSSSSTSKKKGSSSKSSGGLFSGWMGGAPAKKESSTKKKK